MKNKKDMIPIIAGLVIILAVMVCMDINFKNEVKKCVEVTHNENFCEQELAK